MSSGEVMLRWSVVAFSLEPRKNHDQLGPQPPVAVFSTGLSPSSMVKWNELFGSISTFQSASAACARPSKLRAMQGMTSQRPIFVDDIINLGTGASVVSWK